MKEPDHQFLHYLCEIFRKSPNDPFFEEMDPVEKIWWYENWIAKQEKEIKRDKYLGILIGSFTNPKAAQDMMKDENPDFVSTDEDFERSLEMVKQGTLPDIINSENEPTAKQTNRKRRRKVVNKA